MKNDKDNPIRFVKVRLEPEAPKVLWDLMAEVLPDEAISHKAMPTWEAHVKFVGQPPYRAWYLIQASGEWVGSILLTQRNEIGIRIFRAHHRKGYATWAITELMRLWQDRLQNVASHTRKAFVANINPKNEASKALFRKFGFNHIQDTYAREV